VARDRQRAKQRQAERRARRLAQEGGDGHATRDAAKPAQDTPPDVPDVEDPRAANPAPGVFPDVATGAPPEDLGRTDRSARDEPADYWEEKEQELDEVDPELEAEAMEAGAVQSVDDPDYAEAPEGAEPDEAYAPRGRRGDTAEAHRAKDRPRVVQFLIAVWAELQRVQWPNRQALTTLTGVVLGFVLIAGGYLGLLDAIFSRIIQAIL
jgi:preprotein translocase subunit SecE